MNFYRIILLSFLMSAVVFARGGHKSSSKGSPHCATATKSNPFDDLSYEEIQQVTSIIKKSKEFPPDIRFAVVKTQEPKKADWLSGKAKNQRQAYVALFNLKSNILTEVIIDLKASRIVKSKELGKGILPPMLNSEFEEAETIIRADPRWKGALAKRSINPDDTKLDIWASGPFLSKQESENATSRRIIRAITNYNYPSSKYFYWHPVEGFVVTADLNLGKVIDLWDNEITPLAPPIHLLPENSTQHNRPPLKPLIISQPEGSSIKLDGQQVSWYKWKFQYSVDPVIGLQLYHVRYTSDCEERMILYKMSLSEMFIPYLTLGQTWSWRNAFDIGEYGIGTFASKLKPGLDVPDNALVEDCVFADEIGSKPPVVKEACVALYERDASFLYKHTGPDGGTDVRRGRQLVLTLITVVGNYDYAFDYVFNMDGTINVLSRLSGIILARGNKKERNSDNCFSGGSSATDKCTNFLGPHLTGPTHQHFFNMRLDFDIDGESNYIEEMNLVSDGPGGSQDNPFGGNTKINKKVISKETSRDHEIKTDRRWIILNKHSTNEYSTPRGYALKINAAAIPLVNPQSSLLRKSAFVTHPVWVSKYKDDEQRASGDYPRSSIPSNEDEGLGKFISDRESVLNKDLVFWHTFGITHVPKSEEWPIMTIHETGFSLVPWNFLSRNAELPILDACEASL